MRGRSWRVGERVLAKIAHWGSPGGLKREEERKEEGKCEDGREKEKRGEGVMFQNAGVLCY